MRCSIPGISHGIVESRSSTANVRSKSSTPVVDCVTIGSKSSTPVVGCVIVVVRGSTLGVDHAIGGSMFRHPSFRCLGHFLLSRCRCHCHFLPSVDEVALYHSFSPFVSSS